MDRSGFLCDKEHFLCDACPFLCDDHLFLCDDVILNLIKKKKPAEYSWLPLYYEAVGAAAICFFIKSIDFLLKISG
jgi:hypothetical protein